MDIAAWLRELGLERYEQGFRRGRLGARLRIFRAERRPVRERARQYLHRRRSRERQDGRQAGTGSGVAHTRLVCWWRRGGGAGGLSYCGRLPVRQCDLGKHISYGLPEVPGEPAGSPGRGPCRCGLPVRLAIPSPAEPWAPRASPSTSSFPDETSAAAWRAPRRPRQRIAIRRDARVAPARRSR